MKVAPGGKGDSEQVSACCSRRESHGLLGLPPCPWHMARAQTRLYRVNCLGQSYGLKGRTSRS